MKLVKPFTPYEASQAIYCVFRQKWFLISRTVERKEQNARYQCFASAMPKSVMLSGDKNGEVSEEKKHTNLAVLAKTTRLKRFYSSKAFKQQR